MTRTAFHKLLILALAALIGCFSLTAQEQAFVPLWVKDAVFYQIFPERFANGDATNDPPGVQPWGGRPTGSNFFGGDLEGVISHLDYLQSLGVNALYLTPVFESPTNHKYHTTDYMHIDRHFGTDSTFHALLNECHRRSMHVVIDAVFNHTGRGFFAFQDVIRNEQNSRYRGWYDVHGFPVAPVETPNYEAWHGIGDLPKLMTDNPEVRNYLFDVARHWTSMGLDGWRLDAPAEISHDFWIQLRKLIKGINPDAYIVGELWDDASPWLKGDQFDAVMNYRFRGACVGFIALENRNAVQFDSMLAATRNSVPTQVSYTMQNLIGSHDTERFLTLSDSVDAKVKLAALMQMTYVGAPMIYYGDEIGMTGGRDPDCRKPMVWDSTRWDRTLLAWYRQLIAIRNQNPVFRRGTYQTVLADSSLALFGFLREEGGTRAIVFLNMSKETRQVPSSVLLSSRRMWKDLLGGGEVDISKGLPVGPLSGVVLLSTKGK